MTTIYLVRHGETEWNTKRFLQGHKDSPLTENGKEQGKILGKKLEHIQFDAVFSSDLPRAVQTAEFIMQEKKLAIITSHALREQSYGTYDGTYYPTYREELKEQFEKMNALKTDQEKMQFQLHPEIERHEEVVSRFITFIREIAVAYAGKNVLIVTHGGVMKYFLIHMGVLTYKQILSHNTESIKNSAWIKLESDGIDFFLKETEGIHIDQT